MRKFTTYALMALAVIGLSSSFAPAAEAYQARPVRVVSRHYAPVHTPRVTVRVHGPRVTRNIVIRPPLRTYAQVYVGHRGQPHRVYVPAHYNRYQRQQVGYWTWTY